MDKAYIPDCSGLGPVRKKMGRCLAEWLPGALE